MANRMPHSDNRHNGALVVLIVLAVILTAGLFPFSLIVIGPTLIGIGIVAFRRADERRTKRLLAVSVVIEVCVMLFGGYVLLTAVGIKTQRGVDVHNSPLPIERQSSTIG